MTCDFVWTGSMEEFFISKCTFQEFNYYLERWLERIWRKIPLSSSNEFERIYRDETARIEITSMRGDAKVTMSWNRSQHGYACMFVLWLHHEWGAQLPDWFDELQYRNEDEPFFFARPSDATPESKLLASAANMVMREMPYPNDDMGQAKYINEVMEKALALEQVENNIETKHVSATTQPPTPKGEWRKADWHKFFAWFGGATPDLKYWAAQTGKSHGTMRQMHSRFINGELL